MSFHHWMSTDGDTVDIDSDTVRTEVSCLLCGTTAPEWGYGAPYFTSVGHSPLPIWCPGVVVNSHHFEATGIEGDDIVCYRCNFEITGDTHPDFVDWECVSPE